MTNFSKISCLLAVGLGVACSPRAGTSPDSEWPGWSVLNIAHRGGIAPGHGENTLAAFRRAVSLGVDAIEIDLRASSGGDIVIIHDRTLDRTTDGTGKVTDRTLADLKKLDAGGGESIPTYAEVLDLVAGTGVDLVLDIKDGSELDRQRVVRLAEERGAVLDVVLGVRTVDDLRAFRALNPNIRALGFIRTPEGIEEFVTAGVDIIRLKADWILRDPALVKRIQKLGKPVWATAGDAPREVLVDLILAGVNGILTFRPEALAELKREIDAKRGGKSENGDQ